MNYLIKLYAKCEELEKLIQNHIAMLDRKSDWFQEQLNKQVNHTTDYYYYESLLDHNEEVKDELQSQLEVINATYKTKPN